VKRHDDLERDLARWFEADAAEAAPSGQFERVIGATRMQRPRPALTAGIGSAWVEIGPEASPRIAMRMILAIGVLILALAAAAVYVGSQPRRLPAIVGPAASGLIAYASGGDIYVGDPATGGTEAIVTGPEVDSGPIFSPDGTQIAFVRGDQGSEEASIVVIHPDGSDERVVMPAGFSGRGAGFAWTPDSASLVVNYDSLPFTTPHFDGQLALFDASGAGVPQVLTPPLPRWIGAWHPQARGEVAPMWLPPSGDRILSYDDPGPPAHTSTLVEMNIDGSNVEVLLDPARMDLPFEIIRGALWSPDGRWIAVTATDRCRQPSPFGCYSWAPNQRIYIVSADGSQVRRLTSAPPDMDPGRHISEEAIAWSPDGSWILVDRTTADHLDTAALKTETFPITGETVAVDVATGAERAVTTPTSGAYGPPYGPAPSGSQNGIVWVPSSTSTWSPDGRSVLVFKGPGTRPIVIDVETGAATELPWACDSHPSWQRDGETDPS
jgi:Tol biopolymer transport system component